MPDPIAEPVARRLRGGDWERLAGFTCAGDGWYAAEVETFVNERMRGEVERTREHLETEVVLLVSASDENDILAVGAHRIDDQVTSDGEPVEGSYLIVGAVRADLQGVLIDVGPLEDGRPVTVGRWLMQVLVDDLPERAGVVRAVVAKDNARSLRLCDRIGLCHSADDRDPRFVQRTGRLG